MARQRIPNRIIILTASVCPPMFQCPHNGWVRNVGTDRMIPETDWVKGYRRELRQSYKALRQYVGKRRVYNLYRTVITGPNV